MCVCAFVCVCVCVSFPLPDFFCYTTVQTSTFFLGSSFLLGSLFFFLGM